MPTCFVYVAAEGIKNAGADLTVDSLVKGMESVKNYSRSSARPHLLDKSHAGVTGAKLFQVKSGRWTELWRSGPAIIQRRTRKKMGAATELLQQLASGTATGCIYALVALGFILIFKATEVVNFAQGGR